MKEKLFFDPCKDCLLAGIASLLNGRSKTQKGWHVVVYEEGEVREG